MIKTVHQGQSPAEGQTRADPIVKTKLNHTGYKPIQGRATEQQSTNGWSIASKAVEISSKTKSGLTSDQRRLFF